MQVEEKLTRLRRVGERVLQAKEQHAKIEEEESNVSGNIKGTTLFLDFQT